MQIIYIHGLDSSANSVKGVLLEQYCLKNHKNIKVIRPDLNMPPDKVMAHLCDYFKDSKFKDNKFKDGKGFKDDYSQTMVMGSSLGGYFASLVCNEFGCPAVLLNPSTQPHISLQRFLEQNQINSNDPAKVVYESHGGWQVTLADLQWFQNYQLTRLNYPQQVFAVIKAGDELLDASIANQFYESQGAKLALQEGGDHRMTDFEAQLPMIMDHITSLS